ncbi:MAG: hypothetical protein E7012_01555 [Alphaproteobacteria bacterium]|nr:hypothetical protein [Alphaproteobacteria bacterium]
MKKILSIICLVFTFCIFNQNDANALAKKTFKAKQEYSVAKKIKSAKLTKKPKEIKNALESTKKINSIK